MLPPGKFQAAAWTGLIGLLMLSTSGCGDSNDPGGGGDLVSQQIGPAGGTVRSSDGRLTLIFPADAVSQTQTITIEPLQPSEVGSEFSAFSVEHAYRLGPDGLAFQKAITASVPSAPAVTQPAGTHALSMALLLTSANAAAGALDSVRVEQVDGAMVLRGELSHFSTLVETRPHVTVTIEGIPTEMAVNTNFIARVTAVGDVLELETVGYHDASVAPIRSLDTPGSEGAHLDKVGPNTFAGSFVYTCDAAGRGAYRVTGDIRFTAASLPLIPHFYLLFYPAPIDCVAPANPTLTVTKTGSGSGTVVSNPVGIVCGAGDGCTEQYAVGTGVSLTATPDDGSIFVEWTGACPSGSPTTTVVIDADKTCTVRFDREPTITQTSFISRPFQIGAAGLPPSNIGGGNQNTLVVVGSDDAGTLELYDITNPAAPVLLPGSGNGFCPDAGSVFFAPHPSGSGVPYFIATSLLNFQKCANTIPLGVSAIANLPFAPGQGGSVPGTLDIVISDFGGGRLRRVALTGGPFANIPLALERSCPNDLAISGNLALVVGEEGFPGTTLDCTRQTNLFFVDLTTNQATGSVDVGTTPRRVVPSPDGQRAYVSGFGEDCIFVVNTSTKTVERTFAVGDGPFGMAFTPDGSDLLVVNRTEHRLQVLDPSTGEERLSIDTGGINPEDVIVAPDGRTVIVVNSGDTATGAGGSISVFNLVP